MEIVCNISYKIWFSNLHRHNYYPLFELMLQTINSIMLTPTISDNSIEIKTLSGSNVRRCREFQTAGAMMDGEDSPLQRKIMNKVDDLNVEVHEISCNETLTSKIEATQMIEITDQKILGECAEVENNISINFELARQRVTDNNFLNSSKANKIGMKSWKL